MDEIKPLDIIKKLGESQASTPDTGMKPEGDTPQFGVSETATPSEMQKQEVPREEGNEAGETAGSQQEPAVIERIPVKVYGKDGEIVRYSDGRIVLYENGEPKKEFSSIQEAFQKALASDEAFQKASQLKREIQEREKELEAKRQQLAEVLINAIDKMKIGGEEAVTFAKSLGIKISQELEEAVREGDEDAIKDLYNDVINIIKKQKDEIEKELSEIKTKMFQEKIMEIHSKEPIARINTLLPDKMLGSLFINGIIHAVSTQAIQSGVPITPDQVFEIANAVVSDLDTALKEYAKSYLDEIIDDASAKDIVYKILAKYPAIKEEITSQLASEVKSKLEQGKNSAVPTPQSNVAVGNVAEMPKGGIGIGYITEIIKKISGG